jgi:RND family efflux transporter MFP subunit
MRRLLCALVALIFVACTPAAKKRTPIAVRVEKVAPSSAAGTARYSGTVQAQTQIELAFRIGGYVAAIAAPGREARDPKDKKAPAGRQPEGIGLIQSGDRVNKDMVLAVLRQSDYKQRLSELSGMTAEASAGYAKAKADLDRAKTLFAEGSIPQAEFDAIKARHDALAGSTAAAAARTSQASIALSDTKLRSPLDGIILDRRVEVGTLVAPGVPVFAIADTTTVKVVFGVPDSVQRDLSIGSEVGVTTDAVADRIFTGTITKIAAQADPKTRVFDVEASIDNRDGTLKVGMVTTIQLGKPGHTGDTVILVPLSAVVRIPPNEQGFWVFVTSEPAGVGQVSARGVELGNLVGNRVIVTKGLLPGEQVVVQGATLARDGDQVNIVPGSPALVASAGP